MTDSARGTVLVVDDEFAIAETLQDLLTQEGYRVVCAGNGKEALARMAEGRPDLVLTDLMMPGMGGIELLRAMRADPALKDVPVLVMSSAPRPPAVKEVQAAAQISGFFRKPFDLALLLETVAGLLGSNAAKQ